MLGALTLLLVSLTQPEQTASTPAFSPADFREWFDSALAGELAIPRKVRRSARCYRYIFVGGFHSERMPGYFAQNAKELRAVGVPKGAIHFVYPSSHDTVEENADLVRSAIKRIARAGTEKLVIIGHSRGACDTLAFALENPEFIDEHVEAMFLVQGVFGGTGVADYLAGDGPPIDGRMPIQHRVVAHLLGRMERFLLNHGKHGGLPALTTEFSKEFWEQALEQHQAAIPVVSPKAFYVTTRTKPKRLPLFQQAIAWYVGYLGPNDGIVALKDQSLRGVGTVVAVLDAGHTELTNRFPGARSNPRLRRAIVDAIVMAIAEPVVKLSSRDAGH
jgi:pimeloyl-ACP methyl ester carboxylesterase